MGISKTTFPLTWTDEEQTYAKAIQKEMGLPEIGMPTIFGIRAAAIRWSLQVPEWAMMDS
jgi:hypothetical protein